LLETPAIILISTETSPFAVAPKPSSPQQSTSGENECRTPTKKAKRPPPYSVYHDDYDSDEHYSNRAHDLNLSPPLLSMADPLRVHLFPAVKNGENKANVVVDDKLVNDCLTNHIYFRQSPVPLKFDSSGEDERDHPWL